MAATDSIIDDEEEVKNLNEEQQAIFDAVVIEKKNVYFDGEAGTGKSFTFVEIAKALFDIYGGQLRVTASTGVAAVNVNGTTLHKWSGLGLMDDTLEKMIKNANKLKKIWLLTKVLMIEEISMITGEMMDKIDKIAKAVRGNTLPFGGIQVVLCGDFSQLPPVKKIEEGFCFEAECWETFAENSFRLKQVYRQKDEKFLKILKELRTGNLSEESCDILLSRVVGSVEDIPSIDGIKPTILFCRRDEAEKLNKERLDELKGAKKTFFAEDKCKKTPEGMAGLRNLQADCQASAELTLKVGAQVMLLKNLKVKDGLCNGSRGVVKGYFGQYPVVKFMNGIRTTIEPAQWHQGNSNSPDATRSQIPLALAWAITIHKAQGMQLQFMGTDISNAFEEGQAYVAISRCESLENLYLLNAFDPDKVRASQKVSDFHDSIENNIRNRNRNRNGEQRTLDSMFESLSKKQRR